ncbi:hypothetical protein A2V71_02095 [Candidatus Berkelbacteria bacterium RBG_13_40_8]|uniref:Uncharacterized protein n=1 Tax=Candidatus Berkelbacteria bacterium RBG_13_40_8 TaxID=1797467 RepID=A0A1F5DPU2_9BACT|nr:MAG: hypothetical protein A2V71_02095 [Candidatus Berkelbacteria bacterium RBG_13_40_8]
MEKGIVFLVDGRQGISANDSQPIEDVIRKLQEADYTIIGFPDQTQEVFDGKESEILKNAAARQFTRLEQADICVAILFGQPSILATFLLGRASANRNKKIVIIWSDCPVSNRAMDIDYTSIYQAVQVSGGRVIDSTDNLIEAL